MENIFAKGGKTKVKYDYIPQKAIDELSYTIDKVTKGISGDKLLSGVYVKSDAKSKTKSGSNLTAKILAMTDDEDKKEVILEKDVKEFQKYISDKLITAFYLGLPLAYDFKGDYSYGGGVITMVVDDAKRKTTQAIKNAKNKKFELGLKYPQYDFEKLLGKPIIKDVFGKTMTFNDGTTEKYKYRLWIWKDCVIGQTLGSENSSRGFNDYTYGKEPTLIGGYKSVQTSKESKLESIINFMAKDKDGFVKDNNVLYNGLGGANFETLETNKIKYAKGGEMNSDDIVSVYQFGKEKDADDFFLMADKFTDYDVLRLSPFAIQYVGGKEGFEFLYDRAETYESNSLDLYAKGGKTKRSKHSIMQDRRRVSSEPWEVAYQKRKAKMEAGGTLPTPFGQAGLVGETGTMNEVDLFAMGGGLPQGVHQYYAQTYNPAYPTPHGYAKGGMTDVERQSMIDMGYSEEQIKEVEDNPRRGGRFAKGGEIQMSEVYNVNGKDYLFHTPLQNDKGTYTGWDAYEVVYDIKDGEKHLNYTKTKKGKSKYFPNGVKRTEAEDYFAKGGKTDGDTLGDFKKRLLELGDKEFVEYKEKQLKNRQDLYYAFQDRLKDVHKQTIVRKDDLPFEKGGEIDAFIMKFVKDAPASNLRVDSEQLTAKLKRGGKLANKMAKGGDVYDLRPSKEMIEKEIKQLQMHRPNALTDLERFRIDKKIRQNKEILKHRKSKMEAGGTLPTPFGQAGLVGETGTMNEIDLFAMGGGLPQGVHQYYGQTYNPAYPTPHGYAKGGRLDVKRIKSKKFKTKKEAEKRMNYLKTNPFYDKNGKKIILRGIRIEKEQDGYMVNASFLKRDYKFAKGGSVGGRYLISLDGRNDLWRGNDYDEAYDEFINQRSKYLYKMDVILIDTLNDETLDYYDAQEDREQDDDFAKGGSVDDYITDTLNFHQKEVKAMKQKYRGHYYDTENEGFLPIDENLQRMTENGNDIDWEFDYKPFSKSNLMKMVEKYPNATYIDFSTRLNSIESEYDDDTDEMVSVSGYPLEYATASFKVSELKKYAKVTTIQ